MRARIDPRPNAQDRGYSHAWNKASRLYRRLHPLCEICSGRGLVVPAEEVHHRMPVKNGGALLDFANLQSLCKSCHQKLTQGEHGKPVRLGCDEAGLPIDPSHAWNA